MKANRKFVQADEAVSPVIAVILMVAITVVLAATVFVLVSDIGSQSGKTAPSLSVRTDESLDRLIVDSAASGADWNRNAVRLKSVLPSTAFVCVGDDAGVAPATTTFQNEPTIAVCAAAGGNDLTLAGDLEITGANDPINAGDYLEFCSDVVATDLVVTLVDTSSNSALGDYTFLTLAVCA